VVGWGYSEVGRVVEAGPEAAEHLPPGAVVHGAWGHCSETVLPWGAVAWRRLPAGVDPLVGVFSRVGAIALNAVLAADLQLGETVAIFGQGVIGLLATRLAVLGGARVVAVEGVDHRLALAREMGATHVVDFREGGIAAQVKGVAGPDGIDVGIELSGSHDGLREAIRVAPPDGRVVAAGFYQGGAEGVRLGDEFHHNRVQLVASQIGAVPPRLQGRWDVPRLHRVVDDLMATGRLDVTPLVSHVLPVQEAATAYRLLDERAPEVLQVVLDFRATPAGTRHPGTAIAAGDEAEGQA
jgi:threonine dehydrogenase-like Zn-dependent dehydrogenase